MIYTFSPNWYKPQCLHFKEKKMYYCSNYLLYSYDLQVKKIDYEICFRQIAIDNHLNFKDIKINAINSNKNLLFIGINQPYFIILDKYTREVHQIKHIDGFQSIQYIHVYSQNQMDQAVICNKDGLIVKVNIYQEVKYQQKIQIKHKLSGVKAIYQVNKCHCIVFTRGTILIYSSDFSKLERVIQISHSDTIYSVDYYEENQKKYFVFLTKSKQNHLVTFFEFCLKEQFPLQFKKKVEEIGINIKRFYVNFGYPKKFSQKLKNSQKASLSIKLINAKSLIITGKFGQISTLKFENIKNDSMLWIKPYSYQEQEQTQYQIWADSRHYKEIYFIYQHLDRLYIISTDHNLTVWIIKQGIVKYLYSIKFLTSSVSNFFYSESDNKNIYALLKDSAIRSFTPVEEGGNQINQFWKFSKKFKIKRAVCHPFELGVLSLMTECNKIQLYDVLEDRLMKLIEINEEIINVTFEYASIIQQIQKMFKCQFKAEKIQYVSHFVKQMENKTILFIQTKNTIIIASNLAQKQLIFAKCSRQKRLQRIHQNRYWDERSLLASNTKGEDLNIFLYYKGLSIENQSKLPYQQSRNMFKFPSKSEIFTIISFKSIRCTITHYQIHEQERSLVFQSKVEIVFLAPIDYLHINYSDWRIAIYSQREDMIAVLDLGKIKQEKIQVGKNTEDIKLYSLNTKLETLSFYLEDYIILATKDQTIKVVLLDNLAPYKNKKIKPVESLISSVRQELQEKGQSKS